MADRTTDEIATLFAHGEHSVTLINSIAAQSTITDEDKDTIDRNVRHLEIIKAYKHENDASIWTTEDWTTKDNAITLGKSKL
jgi:hypothetical protein|tara:strand:- start:132 stop:377 length:246 start_codon:yes stop_codon:yes gene_type:complete